MTKKGVGFVKGLPFYEVDLLKNDSHEAVISKVANALALDNSTDSAEINFHKPITMHLELYLFYHFMHFYCT